MHFLLFFQCIYEDEPGGLRTGKQEVVLLDPCEDLFTLEMFPRFGPADAIECGVRRKDKKKSKIRGDSPSLVYLLQPGERIRDVSFEGDGLVCIPAVRIPVRYYQGIPCEPGPDHRGEVFGVVCCEEKGFSDRVHLFRHCPPDLVADPAGPRFAGKEGVKVGKKGTKCCNEA